MHNPGAEDREQGSEIHGVEVGATNKQTPAAKFTALHLAAFGGIAAVATAAIIFLASGDGRRPPPVNGDGEECCGDSPAGFASHTILPIDAGNPIDPNKCTKSRLQSVGGQRPLCAITNTTGYTANPCVITGLRASGCACYEGQAHACDPDGGGPCTSGTNCGVRACIVTSDTSSTWSPCTCM